MIDSIDQSLTFKQDISLSIYDEHVGAMSIAPNGRDVVYASRYGLFVLDLEDLFSPPRELHHLTSWEVADVQWSPHPSKPAWVISTSNQKALVWNLALPSSKAIEHVLHDHQRAITDINFHNIDPEMVATCSVDTKVFCWDMRAPKRPSHKFADWRAAASQVKWDFTTSYKLASSHDRTIHVWDIRKGSIPLFSLEDHKGKVNGLDFSRTTTTELISCSNDGTVKLWDLNKGVEQEPATFHAGFPVWRARHTPFGHGCAIMPVRGNNNCVTLTNIEKNGDSNFTFTPVHNFSGHTKPLKEFLWRARTSATDSCVREYQLLTWGKDNDLRITAVGNDVTDLVGGTRTKTPTSNFRYTTFYNEPQNGKSNRSSSSSSNFVSPANGEHNVHTSSPTYYRHRIKTGSSGNNDTHMTGANVRGINRKKAGNQKKLKWISGVRIGTSVVAPITFDSYSGDNASESNNAVGNHDITANGNRSPTNLAEEITIVGTKFAEVQFESINVSTGNCAVAISGPWGNDKEPIYFHVNFKFPVNYPVSPPQIFIGDDDKFAAGQYAAVVQEINSIATTLAGSCKYSLEPCLLYLQGKEFSLDSYFADELDASDGYINDDLHTSIDEDDENELFEATLDDVFASESDEDYDDVASYKPSDSVPLPKGCGAMWTRRGELVCFFAQKKTRGTAGRFGAPERLFDTTIQVASENGGDAAYIYESSDSESDSDEYEPEQKWSKGKMRVMNFRQSNHDSPTFTHVEQTKNVVKILDYSYLIPSKRGLAMEYRITKLPPLELCQHNAEVAVKSGAEDVAACWSFLSLILESPAWLSHPFGNQWFINEIFKYFEAQKNTQMLAIMSCVLSGRNEFAKKSRVLGITQPSLGLDHNSAVNPVTAVVSPPKHIDLPRPHFSRSNSKFAQNFASPSTLQRETGRSSFFEENIIDGLSASTGMSPSSNSPERFHGARKAVANFVNTLRKGSIDGSPPLSLYQDHPNAHSGRFANGENGERRHDMLDFRPVPRVTLQITNKNALNVDIPLSSTSAGCEEVGYLGPELEAKCIHYREQYANILYSWGLEIRSLEVLKFNFGEGYGVDKSYKAEIVTAKGPTSKTCTYCQLKVITRFMHCFTCSHLFHYHCAEQWFDRDCMKECPSGCGCNCLVINGGSHDTVQDKSLQETTS